MFDLMDDDNQPLEFFDDIEAPSSIPDHEHFAVIFDRANPLTPYTLCFHLTAEQCASLDPARREPSAHCILPGGEWGRASRRLWDMKDRVWKNRLRSCRDCGEDFRGPAWTTVRCPRCRAAKR